MQHLWLEVVPQNEGTQEIHKKVTEENVYFMLATGIDCLRLLLVWQDIFCSMTVFYS
jgi:hypothetical protein